VIRRFDNKYQKHVTGDVIVAPHGTGESNNHVIATVYITEGESRGPADSFDDDAANVDPLVQHMAREVLRQVNPYLYAADREGHGDYQATLETIQRIIHDPDEKPISKRAFMLLWCKMLYYQKNYEQGAAKAREILNLYPEDADAHYDLGLFLARQGNGKEGISEFRRTTELSPKYAKAYNNWGMILMREAPYDEAISKFELATQKDPNLEEGYVNLGSAFANEKRYDDAIVMFEKAASLDPKDGGLYDYWGYVYLMQNKCQEAETKFKQAINFDPKLKHAYEGDSLALGCLGRNREAAKMNRQAVALPN
jgi:tetratricopeptide (TPR) repeat protein